MREIPGRPLNVLHVDPDDGHRRAVEKTLSDAENPAIEVAGERLLSSALKRLSRGGIDLVLLELELPDSEGLVTFERTYAFAPDVPIIVLTDLDDQEVATRTVQGGAQDFLGKREVEKGLLARSIRYAVERHRLLSALRSLSLIDDLTGLYNRRGFRELGAQHLKLARRMARGVLLLVLDIDRFKTINDTLGHHVGDRVLIRLAELLKATFRRSDLLARLDGDDFGVLAMQASDDDADLIVERFRERVREFNGTSREPYRLSVSLGVSLYDPEVPASLERLLERAEEELKEDRRGRRSRVGP